MKILVIGGTRFIGRYIVNELLKRGHKVIIYHRGWNECEFLEAVEHIHGDRRDYTKFKKDMAKLSVDCVVDVIPLYPADSKVIIDCFHNRIQCLVHISSGSVYGMEAVAPFSEDEQHLVDDTRDPYGYSKRLCERLIIESQKLYTIPCTILRLPAVYGPHDYCSREWYFIKRIFDRRKYIILPDGGSFLVHQCYVEDVARAVAIALENPPTKVSIYNIGHKQVLNLKQITHLIATVLNHKWEEVKIPSELIPHKTPYSFQRHLIYNLSKIKCELGFEESLTVEQGMQKTIDWLCRNVRLQKKNMHKGFFDYALEDQIIQEYRNFATNFKRGYFEKKQSKRQRQCCINRHPPNDY